MTSPITTHVLDTAQGRPAEGITVLLERLPEENKHWQTLGQGVTNADGRITDLLPDNHVLEPGVYRLTFKTGDYFKRNQSPNFYPSVPVLFEIQMPEKHYHVPLLLSPFGYSTYRGS